MRAIAVAAVLVVACHGGGGGHDNLPAAIAKLAQGGEAQKFDAWKVPGVTLYRITQSVPDHTSTSIVGIDAKTGEVVTGAVLVQRMGSLPADELAKRMFGVALRDNGRPLMPDETDHMFATAQQWSVVEAPTIVDGTLVFYSFRGEMAPELGQYKIRLGTLAVTFTDADQILLARGETVTNGPVVCEPLQSCHCWVGCARFQMESVPGVPGTVWVRVGSGEQFVREDCKAEPCARVCRADSPTANCDPALVERQLACDKSCPPSEAPYHCEAVGDDCKRVEHPTRTKKTP